MHAIVGFVADSVPLQTDTKISAQSKSTGFKSLLSESDWYALPVTTRRRFNRSISDRDAVVFTGQTLAVHMNWAGRLLVQAARLIGAPLPTSTDVGLPSVVSVTLGGAGCGGSHTQIWSRQYGRNTCFPQVIHSTKRFAGPTGLEEHVGHGIGMALTLAVESQRLIFRSDHFLLPPVWVTTEITGLAQSWSVHRDSYRPEARSVSV